MTTLFRRRAPQTTLDLDRRLRHTLHTVAEAMPDGTTPAQPATNPAQRRSGRRLALIMAAVAVPLAAAGYVLGPEYVDQIPPKNPMFSGDAHGERYWVIPGRVRDDCGERVSDVELVLEEENAVGEEWITIGISYGDPRIERIGIPSPLPGGGSRQSSKQCGTDRSAWLADPTRLAVGHLRVADDRIYLVGVHPGVRSIKVTTATQTAVLPTVPSPGQPAGPRFAAFDVPANSADLVVTLLDANGRPIPNGTIDPTEPHDGP